MRPRFELASVCLLVLLVTAATAQEPASQIAGPATVPSPGIPVALNWMPPELASLGEFAEVSNSFVLDRTMLGVAAGLLPQSEAGARQSIRKLDGVAIHLYRFHDPADIDPARLDAVRQAYHVHGWQHLVSADKSAPLHNGKTDLWLAIDGIDVRGGTLLVATPRSLSLITFAGNLNPIDLLRLRGHFGIPNFAGEKFNDAP